jgi:predicted metalloprotease
LGGIVALVVAAVALLQVGDWMHSVPGTGLPAERIDVTGPAVPIAVVGEFGADTGVDDALDNSAAGDQVVAAVLADLQDFWSAQLSANGGPGLKPLAGGYVSMDSSASSGTALCISNPAQISGNAFYCPQNDGIVFDSSALVPVLLGRYGSAGLAASFAHEFGHAIQARVGPTPADRAQHPDRYPSILIEAQADCAAGAFLAWASAGSSSRVHLPPESLVRAVAPLLDFRDPATIQANDPTAHGLGLDRLDFVLRGFRDGAGGCFTMTSDDLALTLGREGVTTSPPSTLPRYSSTGDALAAAAASVTTFAGATGLDTAAAQTAPEPDDVALAAPLGQFAAGTAVALAAGRQITGTDTGAACFTGAWTASVFGHAAVDQLGSWPTDADEALDLIRSRPGAGFDEVAGFADGFRQGWPACAR